MHDYPGLAQVQIAKLIGQWWAEFRATRQAERPVRPRGQSLRQAFGARLVRLGERLARTGPTTETA